MSSSGLKWADDDDDYDDDKNGAKVQKGLREQNREYININ
jgi:hypothetical protein